MRQEHYFGTKKYVFWDKRDNSDKNDLKKKNISEMKKFWDKKFFSWDKKSFFSIKFFFGTIIILSQNVMYIFGAKNFGTYHIF